MAAPEPATVDEPSSSLRQFASDMATLVRQELDVATSELAQKAKTAGIGAGMISASAITGMLALGSFTALLLIALSLALPLWVAAIIVTVLWTAVTGALALAGKRKVADAAPFVPEKAIQNVKQDLANARRDASRQT